MHEVNTYINRYKKDQEYKESVRRISDRITSMSSTEGLESNYGKLIFEGPMAFKRQNENEYKDKCYLMCFQDRILAFETQTQEHTDSALKDKYFFIDSVEVTYNMNVVVERKRKEAVITVQTFDKFIVCNRNSFNIKVNLRTTKGQNELEELEGKFRNLISKKVPRPCPKHRVHVFEVCLSQPDIDIRVPTPPPTCGECNLYLYGQFFTGYKCKNCDCYYHEHCFIEGSPDPCLGTFFSNLTLMFLFFCVK